MSQKIRFVLNRANVANQLLKNEQLISNVHSQVEGMAKVHPSIKVYRNINSDRANVVATVPMRVEDAHRGLMGQILNGVRV